MAPTTTVYEPRISMDSQNYASGSDDDEKMEDVLSSWVPMTSPEEVKAGRSYFFFQDFIRSPETGYVMNAYFEHFYKETFQSFHVREDDVYLITFPRSGTTWSQELVWCIANDLDFEGAKEQLVKRSPFLEYDALLPPGGLTRLPSPLRDLAEKAQEQGGSDPTKVSLPGRHLEFIDKCPSPRLIKTHLPLSLLPADVRRKKCKIIYVARDARDVCVSSYHLFRGIAGYTGSLEQYVSNFLSGTAMWGPHWKHVLDHWQLRHEPNMLFFTYEDMKANLPCVIDRICNFLGKKFSPEDQARLSEHVSFASMRANEAVAFENNYANVTQRILKPVQEMGLSLENLIEIAADGRLSKVPLGKVLRLIVSGRIPLSVVSSVVAAKVKGRRIALTPGQIAALTGGSLSSEMCSEIARLSSGEASVDGSSQPGTPSKKDQNGTNNNIIDRSSSCDSKKTSAKKNSKIDAPANGKKPTNKEKSPSKTSSSSFKTNFFRKGVVGDGKTTLTPAQNAAFDEYDRNHFASTGLPYGKV